MCYITFFVVDKGDIFGWGNGEYFQIPTLNYEQQIHTPKHLSRIQKLGKIKDVASAGTISMVLTGEELFYIILKITYNIE